MASIKDNNNGNPTTSHIDIVKIVVIGEPRCGKTSFIRAFYDHNDPGDIYSDNCVTVYPCEFVIKNEHRRAAIFEIPSDMNFPKEQRMPHYENANVIVFMYAIDASASLEMLYEKWLPEAADIIKSNVIPVALVGTKKDLQEDQQVIERLSLQNKKPVSYWEGREFYGKLRSSFNGVVFMECSGNDFEEVHDVFDLIFEYSLNGE
ncbi:uncharacterized protein LOC129968218 [Argiope bruennichi]|uniref:GTP-binding protein rhoA like protein n=1 Tax=Argiope bruennichi TaxID=94029 RepID=A0A8T0FLV7_ARGBR|nr:uncharacterized protein LOC129968218 [Argiope bruennichi]KAF8792011.1 GTP-binding protein rhoA like protein [Argiope bruennichi]